MLLERYAKNVMADTISKHSTLAENHAHFITGEGICCAAALSAQNANAIGLLPAIAIEADSSSHELHSAARDPLGTLNETIIETVPASQDDTSTLGGGLL